MRSNYKKLGKYIREVNVRNVDLEVELLLGISIKKIFIPSIANTVGTNMATYKIIQKNQFGYGTVTSRNGDKISIALLEDNDQAIVSQAYKVFEVIDENELLPEYLMMWFRRPEFDRYARFMSHGSTREVFDWNEMCDVELPVPDITKQQEIVDEYNTIKDRISLNNNLIQKLEDTAQAIYKQWFVDFEFPNNEGKPYKTSGGEMVYCEELEKDVPKGWEVKSLSKIAKYLNGLAMQKFEPESNEDFYPVIKIRELNLGNTDTNSGRASQDIKKEYVIENGDIIFSWSGSLVIDVWVGGTGGLNQHLFKVYSEEYPKWFYYWGTKYYLNEFITIADGNKTSLGHIKREHLDNAKVVIPASPSYEKIDSIMSPILEQLTSIKMEIKRCEEIQDLLLSKIATID